MARCCDCGKEEFLYSITCSRVQGNKESTGSRGLCLECANKECKVQGLPAIKGDK